MTKWVGSCSPTNGPFVLCGSAHDCGCVVDGSNAMVASGVLLLLTSLPQWCPLGMCGNILNTSLTEIWHTIPLCTECDCDPGGSLGSDDVCDSLSGDCECVEGVTGRRCDTCPALSIGPNKNTVLPCVDCFCNGYSRYCTVEEGWYQAEVVNTFNDGLIDGFHSNGEIISSQ